MRLVEIYLLSGHFFMFNYMQNEIKPNSKQTKTVKFSLDSKMSWKITCEVFSHYP